MPLKANNMKILFVEPFDRTLFSFRKELLDSLIMEKHEIILCISKTKKVIDEYNAKGVTIVDVPLDLKDKNFLSNFKLKRTYKKIIKQYKPDLILSFTIKPNLYCACYAKNIPMIANVTGLGNLFKKNNIYSKIGIFLYKKYFKNVDYVFFQNKDGLSFFERNKIQLNNYKIIPGSGVNLDKFVPSKIDKKSNVVIFLFASRAIKEKGFNLMIESIPTIIENNKNVHFNFLSAEEDVLALPEARKVFVDYKQFVTLLDRRDDMQNVYRENDFLVLPSFYREGISNVLLESLACGRPIITTNDNAGCKEVLVDNINGFGVKSNDLDSLISALTKASFLNKDTIEKMGRSGREYVEKMFDRKLVINLYLDTINLLK